MELSLGHSRLCRHRHFGYAIAVGDLLISAVRAEFISVLRDQLPFGPEGMPASIFGVRAHPRLVSPMVLVGTPFLEHEMLCGHRCRVARFLCLICVARGMSSLWRFQSPAVVLGNLLCRNGDHAIIDILVNRVRMRYDSFHTFHDPKVC